MEWTINGRRHSAEPDIRTTLLDLLREHLDLTGSKKGCDHGQCGACTVLIAPAGSDEGPRRVLSCLCLAVMHQGDAIVTVEGLADGPETGGALHPMQRAFVTHDGYQCGYCTPGQICSAVGMLDEAAKGWPSHVSADLAAPRLDRAEIAERMSGNLCRCAAYPNIVDAVAEIAGLAPAGKVAAA